MFQLEASLMEETGYYCKRCGGNCASTQEYCSDECFDEACIGEE